MAKQILIDLVFNANTSQAKSQMASLQSLVNTLQSTVTKNISMTGLTSELQQASTVVNSLKANLSTAFNVDTGRLDLGMFSQRLNQSGTSVRQLREALQKLGPDGQQTFTKLTSAVLQSELPLKRTRTIIDSMMSTFGSSIKWTIAYGAIDKIRQGFSDAFQYAQDLNESLTNIGVVAQLDTEHMANFAKKANEAARALGASTVEYTNAALIYYQQGLDGKAVEERVESTIKLANVTGESAQVVSEWMTAIWNNFDDGSKKLEYYGDVLAKLGAETASSADEIAAGFEKFAAVADTVGLSYEKGAAAIATVTATTRQSADVVGTAFKTIFARMQDLELGNTLDDGTSLGQYSEALNKVGINIKTTSGDLKDMDDILAEMGGTWKTLSNDEQVALAKSVAGIRQYTQLIALMDNFDYFERLTASAENASGTLDQQQERWAESWEASTKRIKAASEGIYNNLIDDSFFIGLNNIWADLLGGLDKFMDAMGGLKTLMPLLIGLLTKAFGPYISGLLSNFTGRLKGTNAVAQEMAINTRKMFLKENMQMATDTGTQEATLKSQGYSMQYEFVKKIEGIKRQLNEHEVKSLQYLDAQINSEREYLQLLGKEADKQAEIAISATKQVKEKTIDAEILSSNELSSKNILGQKFDAIGGVGYGQSVTEEITSIMTQGELKQTAVNQIKNADFTTEEGKVDSDAVRASLNQAMADTDGEAFSSLEQGDQDFLNKISKSSGSIDTTQLEKMFTILEKIDHVGDAAAQALDFVKKEAEGAGEAEADLVASGEKYINNSKKRIKNDAELVNLEAKKEKALRASERAGNSNSKALNNSKKRMQEYIAEAKKMQQIPLGQSMLNVVSSMSMLATGISSTLNGFKSLHEWMESDTKDFGDLMSAIGSMGIGVVMMASNLSATGKAFKNLSISMAQYIATSKIGALTTLTNAKMTNSHARALNKLNKEEQLEYLQSKLGLSQEAAELVLKTKTTSMSWKKALAKTKETAAEGASIPVKIASAVASGVLAAAEWAANLPLIAKIALITLIIALTVGLIAGIVGLVNARSAEEKASERAAKVADELANRYQKLKESYESLKESLTEYKDAKDALSQMTQGTLEWQEAVNGVNEKVLELIKTYPELGKYVKNVNGVLTISDKDMYNFQKELGEHVQVVGNAAASADISSERADWRVQRKNLANDIDTASVNEKDIREALDLLAEETEKNGISWLGDQQQYKDTVNQLISSNKKLAEVLIQNKDAVVNLIQKYKNIDEREKQQSQSEITQALMNAGVNDLSNFTTHLSDKASEKYQNEKKAFLKGETYEGDLGFKFAVNTEIPQIAQDWFEETNYHFGGTTATKKGKKEIRAFFDANADKYKNYDIKDYSEEGVKVTYVNEEGEEETEWVDIYTIAEERAAVKMLEKGNDYATEIADQLNIINGLQKTLESTSLSEESEALANFLKDGSFDYTNATDRADLLRLGQDGLKQLISEEDAQKMGYDSIAALWEAMANTLYDADTVTTNIGKRMAENIKNKFEAAAKELEVNEDAFGIYSSILMKENGLLNENSEIAADAAVQTFKLAKGLDKLQKAFKDNIEILKASSQNSLEYAEACGEIKSAFEEIVGFEVSGSFITTHLNEIEQLANNDINALNSLRKEANKEFIMSLAFDDEQAKQNIVNEFERLGDLASTKTIGFELELDSSAAIQSLNEMLSVGAITEQELSAIFANADLEMPPINYYTGPGPTTTTRTTTYNETTGERFTTVSESTTDQLIPYFGNSKPEIKKDGTVNFDTSTIGVKTTGNNKTKKDALRYDKDGEHESSSDKKSRLASLDEEIERYHEIDETIENTERELDKLSKAKDRAFGKDKLALMDAEIAKNKELIAEYEERNRQANEYYQKDREYLLSNYAVVLDEDGNISNYNQLIQTQIDKMKAMDPTDTNYENEEAYLDRMKSAFDKYEDSLDEMNEAQQKVIDLQYEMADLALEKIEYTVQINIEAAEDDMVMIDFLMSKIEDDAFAVAEKIKLQGDAVGAVTEQIKATESGIAKIMADVNSQGFMTEAQAERLREYRDNLVDYEAQLREIKTIVEESLTEAYDAWNEKLDENISKFDHYTSVLDSYKNIIELTGKKNLGITNDMMREMSEIQVQNSQNLLASSKATMDANKSVLETYKQNYANATTEEDKKYWEDQIKIAEENVMSSTESFMSNWENALQTAADAFAENVALIVEEFESSISGIYGSLDALQEAFDRQGEINERYLADYEKTYEFSKLNRQIQNSIDKTDSTKSQRELRDLQQELLALQESGVDVSERDIEFLQKKYDLMLKEQALRDAQNAKSVVRLQRDSEGNYNYVYTADQNNINQAQQAYEDSLYELQKWSEESLNTIQESVLAIQKEFSDAMTQIAEDESLSLEEKEQKMKETTEYYLGQMKYWTDEAQKMLEYNSNINTQYNTNIADSYHDTVIGHMLPDQQNWEDFYKNSYTAMQMATDNFLRALNGEDNDNSFVNMIDKTYEIAGESVKTFADDLTNSNNGYLTQIQKASDETAEATAEMADDMEEYMIEAAGYVSAFQTTYSGYMDKVWESTHSVVLEIGELIEKYRGMEAAAINAKQAKDTLDGIGTIGDSVGGGILTWLNNIETSSDETTTEDSDKNFFIPVMLGQGMTKELHNDYRDLLGTDEDARRDRAYRGHYMQFLTADGDFSGDQFVYDLVKAFSGARITGYKTVDTDYAKHLFRVENITLNDDNVLSTTYMNLTDLTQALRISEDDLLKIVRNQNIPTFDTGGYTGSWGPEGRVAMLHQKEIVLNAQDTENFLSAINIVRSIADQLETNALAAKLGLTAYSAASVKTQGDTLQQEVTIHAEFPNATNHSEIEEAFRNLNLMASQYANRKN